MMPYSLFHYYHPQETSSKLMSRAYDREENKAAKDAIALDPDSTLRMCAEGHRPICQDTRDR